jgi:major membrane immunogen (membrane-anchored lipoprotein)
MPDIMRLDAEFFMAEVDSKVNQLLKQVTDSFLEKDDSGVVTIQIKLKQKDDKGNISAQVEVNSKNAKFVSLAYDCHKTKGMLESGQMVFTNKELNGTTG